MTFTSLSEMAIKLKINKSKLLYYFQLGLLKPVEKVGSMNIFDLEGSIVILKKIKAWQKSGKVLADFNRTEKK
jgi:DNA-binding transcriptional MerR regulator